MATFEKKVSDIFHEQTNLIRHFSSIIPKIFFETDHSFSQRMSEYSGPGTPPELVLLYDIAYMDYFYEDIDNWLLPWIIENHADDFTKDELGEMASQAESCLDFYQVQETQPGVGSQVRSIITGKEFFLNDVTTSNSLTKWDIFLARCYPWKGKYWATGSLTLFSPEQHSEITAKMMKEFEHYKRQFQDSDYAHFAKDRWDVFFRIKHDIAQQAEEKKVYTSFGELKRRDVFFKVLDFQSAVQSIAELEEFEFTEKVVKKDRKKKKNKMIQFQFDWLTSGQEEELQAIRIEPTTGVISTVHQVDEKGNKSGVEYIGDFAIDAQLARLTVNSLELAEYAKARIPEILGRNVAFKRMAKAKPPEPSPAPAEPLDEKIKAKIEEGYFQEYFANILDTAIPALNNLTPREARQDPKTLPLLIEWLKHLENVELKKKKAGEFYVDVNQFKKDLDLTF